jgi:hypothetical protein
MQAVCRERGFGLMSNRIKQILQVIEEVRRDFLNRSEFTSIKRMRREACDAVADRFGVDNSTVTDKFRRQLKPEVESTDDFDRLLEEWLRRDSGRLQSILLKHTADDSDTRRIKDYFAGISEPLDATVVEDETDQVPLASPMDEQRLMAIISQILADLKSNRRNSCFVDDLYRAYSWQGLDYQNEEIENALSFMSTQPFQIFQEQGENYVLTDDIEPILHKVELLARAFSKLEGQ